jgi:hypothetical protein
MKELDKKKKDARDCKSFGEELSSVKTALIAVNSFLRTVDRELEAINNLSKQIEFEKAGLIKEAETQEAILKVIMKIRNEREVLVSQTEYGLELEKNIVQQNADIADLVTKQQDVLNGVKSNELYIIGNTILKIFTKNKLQNSIQDQIQQINRFVDDSLSSLANFKDSL